jgi:hypothetical protein
LDGDTVTAPARIFLAKPGVDTRFHIDFDWWEREGRDFRIDVTKHLLPEYVDSFTGINSGEMIDLVDAETGAVTQVDTAQYTLRTRRWSTRSFTSCSSTVTVR